MNWEKLSEHLKLLGAMLLIGGAFARLWPESVFVFVGIVFLGLILENVGRVHD